MHTFGTITGSGVYRQTLTAALQLKVHPIGQGMLNTINRAELVAILVALQECQPCEGFRVMFRVLGFRVI